MWIVLIRSGQNDTPGARYSHLNTLIEDQLWYEEALRRELDADTSLALFIDLARQRALGGRFYELEFLEQLPQPTETEIRQAFARYKQPVIARHLFMVMRRKLTPHTLDSKRGHLLLMKHRSATRP